MKDIESTYVLSVAERAILVQAAQTLDTISRLEAALATSEVTVKGAAGQPRANPVLGALAQQRATFDRLVLSLSLPAPDEVHGRRRDPQQARRADVRWARRGAS